MGSNGVTEDANKGATYKSRGKQGATDRSPTGLRLWASEGRLVRNLSSKLTL